MHKVLLITYMFPPLGGIGTPRALAYARHLPDQGCWLAVLAPTKPALRDMDPELGALVPASVPVFRAWNPELPISMRDKIWKHVGRRADSAATRSQPRTANVGRWLGSLAQRILFPDPQVVWLPFAWRKARAIVRQHAIDTVVITVPPFSLLKLAVYLHQEFPGLRIVADFRDEWIDYYLKQIDRPAEHKVRRAQQVESEAVAACSYVSTVTNTWMQTLRRRYPNQPATKFICTPNGYEPEMTKMRSGQSRPCAKMIITYFGTIHDNRIYSPANYLRALESLPPEIGAQIETHFIGRVFGEAQELLKRTAAKVRVLGFMPKLEGLRRLAETDFALLIATSAGSHAGKLFDYLGIGKPILALSPLGGEIDLLLQRTRTGWCADPWDPNAIREMLLSAFWRFKQRGEMINPDLQVVEQYSWPKIFARFAEATRMSSGGTARLHPIDASAQTYSVGA